MSTELQHIEEIEKYAAGQLNEPEKQAFEARLKQEPALAGEYTLYQTLIAGIREAERQRLKNRFNRLDQEQAERPFSTTGRRNSAQRYFIMAAAACIAVFLAIAIALHLRTPSADEVIAGYFIDDPGLPVTMSTAAGPALDAAMNYYRAGKYNEALDALSRLPEGHTGFDTIQYYKGLIWLKLHQPDSAQQYLSQVTVASLPLKQKAEYYHAMALWQNHNIEAAKAQFGKIAADSEHPYQEIARNILQEKVFSK